MSGRSRGGGSPLGPIEIFPQRCWTCGGELRHGDQAVAVVDKPIAFCVPCAGDKKRPDLIQALVKDEGRGIEGPGGPGGTQ